MGTLAALFAKPLVKYGAIAVAVLALFVAGLVAYNSFANKYMKLGETKVIGAVQTETIKKLDDARTEKEKANETVRTTPLDKLVDGLQ